MPKGVYKRKGRRGRKPGRRPKLSTNAPSMAEQFVNGVARNGVATIGSLVGRSKGVVSASGPFTPSPKCELQSLSLLTNFGSFKIDNDGVSFFNKDDDLIILSWDRIRTLGSLITPVHK